jgi:hypothetical protein
VREENREREEEEEERVREEDQVTNRQVEKCILVNNSCEEVCSISDNYPL